MAETSAPAEKLRSAVKDIALKYAHILLQAPEWDNRRYARKSQGVVLREIGHNPRELVAQNPGQYLLNDKTVTILGGLYQSLDQSGRNPLVWLVKKDFERTKANSRHSPLLFLFLAKYHSFTEALDVALFNLKMDDLGWRTLSAISDFLRFEHHTIDQEQVQGLAGRVVQALKAREDTKLEALIKSDIAFAPGAHFVAYRRAKLAANRIVMQAAEAIKLRLSQSFADQSNPDLMADSAALQQALKHFGFPRELSEILHHVDVQLRRADSDFDFSACVNHNRTFFSELLRHCAMRIAERRGEKENPAWTGQNGASIVRQYLRGHQFVAPSLESLCNSFYQFASDAGTHKISSGREVARLVRNMNIELGLVILQRLRQLDT